uniref:Uncharacterized protein n=1 Tax=Tanacetum cinerariifolium TaxID=118510 RepID=A0A699LCX7_TANCI|nr:hypothetical protein [Tanacetum cinerariifolium]
MVTTFILNREDLESLWKLVKERFKKTEPKNYNDDYLLKTLRTMFEQPDAEASVWRDQKEPKALKGNSQIKQDEAFARQLEAELNADINWNAVIKQVKRSERLNDAVMKYEALKR